MMNIVLFYFQITKTSAISLKNALNKSDLFIPHRHVSNEIPAICIIYNVKFTVHN